MKILYNPLRINGLQYKINGEVIYINYLTTVVKADFTNFTDGKMIIPLDFIPFAEKNNGELTVTLRQPVDYKGEPLELNNEFDISIYENIEITWKTQEEIDVELNAPKEPTADDYMLEMDFRISMLELGL